MGPTGTPAPTIILVAAGLRARHFACMKAHFYENAGSAGILPVFFTAFSCFVVAILAMRVGMRPLSHNPTCSRH